MPEIKQARFLMQYSYQWAIVDIETTGLHLVHDGITEIAIQILTERGVAKTWHSLIKPKRSIPEAIQVLTGISNEMVQDAPAFEDIAQELLDLLINCVFVAHNARFDFGFIKNAFKQAGITYKTPVLCTIKLLRQLYPNQLKYNLASIAQSIGISLTSHHRAQADVAILHEIIQHLAQRHTWPNVLAAAKTIYQKSSIPSKLTTNISQLPEAPGVYVFYNETNSLPLYIGKSINIRQRVLSHFSGDYLHAKEFALSQQVAGSIHPLCWRIECFIAESELIKKLIPIYNRKLRRKKTMVGFQLMAHKDYLTLAIVRSQVEEDLKPQGIYGAFSSVAAAKRVLLQLIKNNVLCPKLCSMEQGSGSCFSYQLKRCQGACIQKEPFEDYNQRLLKALMEYGQAVWPFKAAIAIKEHCSVNKLTQFSLFHQWRHLGTVTNEQQLSQWRKLPKTEAESQPTYDGYHILFSYLKHKADKEQIFELD